MEKMILNKEYFTGKVSDLRKTLHKFDDFKPVDGISDKVSSVKKISNEDLMRQTERVNS